MKPETARLEEEAILAIKKFAWRTDADLIRLKLLVDQFWWHQQQIEEAQRELEHEDSEY